MARWSRSLSLSSSWVVEILVVGLVLIQFGPSGTTACGNGTCQILDFCLGDADCAQGLGCKTCLLGGDVLPKCFRTRASSATAKDDSLPFNKYAWLTTHNSFSWTGAPLLTGPRATALNQEDSIADQLQNGVRGLMLDTYDFLGDIWLCHSFGGVCYNFTSFEPLRNTLEVIQSFLAANPTEIITLILEDYVQSSNGLSNLFKATGLDEYWFPVASMPQDGEDWPTVRQMVANNWRLLVFTSASSKEASEGIPFEWKYLVENQYGDGGIVDGQCPKRDESAALDDRSRSLVLENNFPTEPNLATACEQNSNSLMKMLSTCSAAAGNRWANFLAVDFYKQSEGGGAFNAVDYLNGQIRCGCTNPDLCQPGYPTGLCSNYTTSVPRLDFGPSSALVPVALLIPFLPILTAAIIFL